MYYKIDFSGVCLSQEMSVKIQMKNNTLFTQRLKHIFKLLC